MDLEMKPGTGNLNDLIMAAEKLKKNGLPATGGTNSDEQRERYRSVDTNWSNKDSEPCGR